MNFESPSKILNSQEKEEKEKKQTPDKSRREFLGWALFSAAAIASPVVLDRKNPVWLKAKNYLASRKEEILKKDDGDELSDTKKEEDQSEKAEIVDNKVEELKQETRETDDKDSEVAEKAEVEKELQEPEVREAEVTESEDIEARENKQEKENIFDKYANAYEEISRQDKYFPGALFPEDLLIAQQFQESKYEKDAVSHAGARGVMQNMPVSIEDVCGVIGSYKNIKKTDYIKKIKRALLKKRKHEGYLHKLYRKEELTTKVPRHLTSEGVEKIFSTMDIPDNSRVMGKLYLMQLWDNKSGYGVGRKQFAEGDIEGAQNEILGAYNAGYRNVKGKAMDQWYEEPREYAENIQKFKKMIAEVRVASEKELSSEEVLEVLKNIYLVKNEEKRKKVIDNMLASI